MPVSGGVAAFTSPAVTSTKAGVLNNAAYFSNVPLDCGFRRHDAGFTRLLSGAGVTRKNQTARQTGLVGDFRATRLVWRAVYVFQQGWVSVTWQGGLGDVPVAVTLRLTQPAPQLNASLQCAHRRALLLRGAQTDSYKPEPQETRFLVCPMKKTALRRFFGFLLTAHPFKRRQGGALPGFA